MKHANRIVRCLDGMWDFALLEDGLDLAAAAWVGMPVPSAFDAHPSFAGMRGLVAYRRRITTTPNTRGRLFFGAVGFWCRVDVDGVTVGEHSGGYSPFWLDVPPASHAVREVTVLVDNRFDAERSPLHEPYFDFYQYGGIYRTVEWHEVAGSFISSVAVHITDYVSGDVVLTVGMESREGERGDIDIGISFDDGPTVTHTVELRAGIAQISARVPTPRVWSLASPALHQVRVTHESDDMAVRFGLRTVGVSGRQITLNGQPVKLLGYCRHEAHPQFGPALPLAQIVQDLEILRDLGCNFIRGTHYPMDQRFLDLCDELGFIVWEETLGWHQGAAHFTSADYAAAHTNAITEMIAASRNHPSVIIWGFLNEGESWRPESRTLYEETARLVRSLDPTRLVTYATNVPETDLHLDLVDIVSVNTYPGWYDDPDDDDPIRLVAPGIRTALDIVGRRGFGDKPFLLSEIGAEALRGWTDALNGLWSEGYQAKYLQVVCEEVLVNEDIAGVSLWQLHDIRSYHGPRAVKRARSFNNKGTLDEYRRPKAAYAHVRKAFRAAPARPGD